MTNVYEQYSAKLYTGYQLLGTSDISTDIRTEE